MRACDYHMYCIQYEVTESEKVQSRLGEDFERTGRIVTNRRFFYVVAPTLDLAEAEFKRYHSRDQKITTNLTHTLNGLVLVH